MYIQFPWEHHILITATEKKYRVYSRFPSFSHSHPISFSAFASKAEKYPAHVVRSPSLVLPDEFLQSPNLPSRLFINMQALTPQDANGRKSRPRLYLSPLPRLQLNPSIPRKTQIRNPDVEFRKSRQGSLSAC